MKNKLFTLLFALMTSVGTMFAMGDNSGSTKANAIEFDWDYGVSYYGGPSWFRLDLTRLYDGAKTIHFSVSNPSKTKSANVECHVFVMDETESREQILAPQSSSDMVVLQTQTLSKMHLTELYFTVTSTEVVELLWQIDKADSITVAQALEIGNSLADKAVTEEEYVIKGYVSNIVYPYDEQYKNETFWISDVKGTRTNDKTQAFEVYRGKPNTQKEIGLDAYIQIRCKIKNYGGIIENATANIEFEVLEQGKVDVPDTISVAKALEIGSALAEMDVTEKEYVIKGYVSNIATHYDSLYKNETFWIADVKGTRTNDKTKAFEVYRGRPNTQKEIGLDAYVQIKCKIMNYRGIIENNVANIPVEILEEAIILDPDTITVAKALEIGSALESSSITEKEYVIRGYVSNISTPFDTLYKNETFWITDTKGARTDDKTQAFLVYRGRPNTQKEIGLDAYIQIKCKILNYYGIIENTEMYEFEVLEQGIIDDTPAPQDANLDVIYIDPSNNEIQRDTVTLHLPAAPKIEGFTFLKWQVVAGDLEDGIFIQAVYTADESSSAPEVYTNPANHAQKLIRNGNVYILRDDKIYSITGQKVK